MNPRFGQGARSMAACLLLLCPGTKAAKAASAALATLDGSVRLPDADGVTIGHGRITRLQLTPAELGETLRFSVTLRMRDLEGLQARIASGEQVADPEMEASYLPPRADFDRVSAWLTSQGFTITLPDRTHTSVFAQGTVASVARAFGIAFARVAVSDGEYTSAVEEPRMPADLAGAVLSVNGLQPEFRLRHIRSRQLPPQDLYGGMIYVTPDNVASAYNFPGLATGSGQTIAIVGEGAVATSDLLQFWTAVGVSQTTANFTSINVNGGPGGSNSGATDEAALDVEWAGALAPGAAIRLYLANNVFNTFTQIMNDVPKIPGMTVVSISYGDTEGDQGGASSLRSYSQEFAQMAAAGLSVLASSGDSGSNPQPGSGAGGYSSTNPLAVNYPASDVSVTGVGGTEVQYVGNWSYAGDIVWNEIAKDGSASGGGVSSFFAKPSWQTGGSVLAGQTLRCVPDVSAISVGDLNSVNIGSKFLPADATDVGVLVFIAGSASGRAGTSLSCPVWAAVAALINQARATSGMKPIGLLNPQLYPLQGTAAFNDVTSGTNGAYSAGTRLRPMFRAWKPQCGQPDHGPLGHRSSRQPPPEPVHPRPGPDRPEHHVRGLRHRRDRWLEECPRSRRRPGVGLVWGQRNARAAHPQRLRRLFQAHRLRHGMGQSPGRGKFHGRRWLPAGDRDGHGLRGGLSADDELRRLRDGADASPRVLLGPGLGSRRNERGGPSRGLRPRHGVVADPLEHLGALLCRIRRQRGDLRNGHRRKQVRTASHQGNRPGARGIRPVGNGGAAFNCAL